MATKLTQIYKHLYGKLGPQHWWPAETPFEVIIGAILTQNTNWLNVEKAIANLKKHGLLTPNALANLDHAVLAELIKPSGYYNVKTKRLKSFLDWFLRRYGGSIEKMKETSLAGLREELLSVKGIGKETADSILLYAAEKPSFVVDAYTYRILTRHGIIAAEDDYETIKELFESSLPEDAQLFNEYHALLVNIGKNYCVKIPRCKICPLSELLGAYESENQET
ncbi:MAG: endonuclease III domain-containing protein [Planctomycetes bacterium]|nr:endonuclease III domain-containing protein [Planctomycetota bacterium]